LKVRCCSSDTEAGGGVVGISRLEVREWEL
jgi:hypothetical protein